MEYFIQKFNQNEEGFVVTSKDKKLFTVAQEYLTTNYEEGKETKDGNFTKMLGNGWCVGNYSTTLWGRPHDQVSVSPTKKC